MGESAALVDFLAAASLHNRPLPPASSLLLCSFGYLAAYYCVLFLRYR